MNNLQNLMAKMVDYYIWLYVLLTNFMDDEIRADVEIY
jgi:hypothetical protein